MRLDLQLRVEFFGCPRFLGIDVFLPRLIAAEADLLAPQRAPVEPQCRAGQAGQEGPVVADHYKRALEPVQPVFQPFDAGEVEMIGWLVEQQEVRFAGEGAGESRTAPFSSAGGRSIALHVDAQLAGNRLDRVARRGIFPCQREFHQRGVGGKVRILLQQHDADARL